MSVKVLGVVLLSERFSFTTMLEPRRIELCCKSYWV